VTGSRLNVLLVCSGSYHSQYGGGQVYVRHLAAELSLRGHSVTAFWFDPSGDDRTEVVPVGGGRTITLRQAGVRDSAWLAAARSVLAQSRPDVVHANGWKAEFAAAAAEEGIPCVVTAHHGGIVCPAGALLDWREKICQEPVNEETCRPCCIKRCRGGRLLEILTRPLSNRWMESVDRSLRRIPLIPFLTPAFRSATEPQRRLAAIKQLALPGTVLIAPSRATAEALRRNRIPASQIVVVPHGIEPFARRPLRPGLGARPVRFVYVGRISPVKGLHTLLTALAQLSRPADWELDIVGEAATKPEIRYRRQLMKIPLDHSRIRWHGRLDRERVGEVIAGGDVLVLPSIYHEVFGLVLLEAHSIGRPVVASRSGGPEDIVRDGENGILLEPGNVEAWAQALRTLLHQPERITAMASNIGPVRTIEDHVADLEAVYDRAIALRTVPRKPRLTL